MFEWIEMTEVTDLSEKHCSFYSVVNKSVKGTHLAAQSQNTYM